MLEFIAIIAWPSVCASITYTVFRLAVMAKEKDLEITLADNTELQNELRIFRAQCEKDFIDLKVENSNLITSVAEIKKFVNEIKTAQTFRK